MFKGWLLAFLYTALKEATTAYDHFHLDDRNFYRLKGVGGYLSMSYVKMSHRK